MKTYIDIDILKNEINKTMSIFDMENLSNQNIYESNLKSILKHLIFYKSLLLNDPLNDKYLENQIYSIFQMLNNSFSRNNLPEVFNLYKRIYIENLFRYLLEVRSTRISMSEMKDCLKQTTYQLQLTEFTNLEEVVDYFYSEHRTSSGILHVNKQEFIEIDVYLKKIIVNNEFFNLDNYYRNIKDIEKLLRESSVLLLIKKFELIDKIFFNRMKELEYLLGKKIYEKFKKEFY